MTRRNSLAIQALGRLGTNALLERPRVEPGQPGRNRGSEKASNINTLPHLPQMPQIETHAHERGTDSIVTGAAHDSTSDPAAIWAENAGQPGQVEQPIASTVLFAAPAGPGSGADRGEPGQDRPGPNDPELALVLAAYAGATVEIRPATPLPPPRWPELSEKARNKRRKWLARDTARFGLVNWELPPPPSRPVRRAFGKLHPPPDPDDEERVATNVCTRCGGPCPPSDLAGSIPRPDGSWVHLACVLKAGGPA
jgi:hypothetical protein